MLNCTLTGNKIVIGLMNQFAIHYQPPTSYPRSLVTSTETLHLGCTGSADYTIQIANVIQLSHTLRDSHQVIKILPRKVGQFFVLQL